MDTVAHNPLEGWAIEAGKTGTPAEHRQWHLTLLIKDFNSPDEEESAWGETAEIFAARPAGLLDARPHAIHGSQV